MKMSGMDYDTFNRLGSPPMRPISAALIALVEVTSHAALAAGGVTMRIVSDIPCQTTICRAVPHPEIHFNRLEDCLAAIQSLHVGKAICVDQRTGNRYFAE
jgi:hypothetical protein